MDPGDGLKHKLDLSDGSLIPDNLPGAFTALVVGIEFDPAGVEVGGVFATATVSAPPTVPAMGPVAGVALAGLLRACGVVRIVSKRHTA